MRRLTPIALLALLLAACEEPASDAPIDVVDTDTDTSPDVDEDDWTVAAGDCDDHNRSVHPQARDIPYDGVDQDCAGNDDFDFDGDGHRAASEGGDDCADADVDVYPGAPEIPYDDIDQDCGADNDWDADHDGFVTDDKRGGSDCDDADPDVHPGAIDIPYDSVDTNCDGRSDLDGDVDGYADAGHGGDDCDDTDALVHPGATDAPYDGVDADCDGASDDDADHDGHDATRAGGDDCDDVRASVYPGAVDEPYDGLDADCAGDDDMDVDGDGWDGAHLHGIDCDDNDPTIHPGAPDDWYDGVDADCAGDSDFDADLDGYDRLGNGDDCNDADDQVHPGAVEVCNDLDDDCDTAFDEGAVDAIAWYVDADHDGYGVGTAVFACDPPTGRADATDDCDDGDETTHPSAAPVACDGIENDCDPAVLEPGGGARIGDSAFGTVLEALDAAVTGDTIDVCEGHHEVGGLKARVGLTLQALTDATTTVLDALGSGAVLEVRTTEAVTVRDLTLTGGGGSTGSGTPLGGGVFAIADAQLTVEDARITDNDAQDGAGIYAGAGAVVVLRRSDVTLGDASGGSGGAGGGVYVGEGGTLSLVDSRITDNTSTSRGGGIFLEANATVGGDATSAIRRNDATLTGGGVDARFGGATLSGLAITDNHAITGAGVFVASGTLTDVTIAANTATIFGGGLATSGVVTITGSRVQNNEAGDGGAIDATGADVVVTLDHCTVSGNHGTTPLGPLAGGVRLDAGVLISVDTDWGTSVDNPPFDIGLVQDQEQIEKVGVGSFTCDDGEGTGCR